MHASRQKSRRWVGVALGAILLLGAIGLAGVVWPLVQPAVPGTLQTADAPTALPEAPVEATEEIIVLTPPPEGEVIHLPTTLPGQIVVVGYPTPTPWPTFTPVPTPTQVPGLVVEPYPTLAVPQSAEGQILYQLAESQEWFTLSVGADARPVKQPEQYDIPLEGTIYKIAPSPNRKYTLLLQQSEPGGIPYVYNNATQEVKPLLLEYPNLPGFFYGWHPNGRQVLFWSLDVALWLVDVENGQTIPLAVFDGPMQGAVMSPDGQYVIYIAGSETSPRSMWKVSQAGSDARVLFDLPTGGYVFGWSPDGRYVLYMGGPPATPSTEPLVDPNAGGGLWLTDPEGKTFRPLFAPRIGGHALSPAWSPDGQWVAVAGYTDVEFGCQKGNPHAQEPDCQFYGVGLYIENIETQELRQIGQGIYPAWSPDGSKVAFVSRQDGQTTIWVNDVTTKGEPTWQLVTVEKPIYQLTWISTASEE